MLVEKLKPPKSSSYRHHPLKRQNTVVSALEKVTMILGGTVTHRHQLLKTPYTRVSGLEIMTVVCWSPCFST
jgi:hypothetical protein